ncbi:MAG: RecQ family ATP-dependent DNA helicase [Bacteroidaceae bacterium]|nr:RecQ family ATP-dependent DNA helicase [Bacteroidaceae bacterium]
MDRFRDILRKYWGYDDFRGIQRNIIDSIASGKDTLGLMPTGGGKSITFQVPALAQDGVCLVITPLIALMKDQVENLKKRGIQATAIYSGMTQREIVIALENCILGSFKFLYISPERLSTQIFLSKIKRIKVSFIAVDESHCISQWGYDFRPSYLKIAEIRDIIPDAPVLALTATATPQVVEDIQNQLKFRERNVFKMSFERDNLAYIVRKTEDKESELIHILNSVAGSAIVYTRNRKGTGETARLLNENGITAENYHAGLMNSEKDARQHKWQNNESRVMVATNAFGMGIDKPDVRIVIHLDLPDSPEAYFQEAGRAGRDGKKAYAVLLYGKTDKAKLKKRIPDTFPDKDYIYKVYDKIAYFFQVGIDSGMGTTFNFDFGKFCAINKLFPVPCHNALKILTRAGYIEYIEEQEYASRVMFIIKRDELYRIKEQDERTLAVTQSLLRSYGGLFADYVNIDESLIAHSIGYTSDDVYHILAALSLQGIIHYIPRKRTPLLSYTANRTETERMKIPQSVYEKRKEAYEERINAMVDYCENETNCRSRMLLLYFGEKNEHECGKCDVCVNKRSQRLKEDDYERFRQFAVNLVSDGKMHSMTELTAFNAPTDRMRQMLNHLLAAEKVKMKDGMLVSANYKQ